MFKDGNLKVEDPLRNIKDLPELLGSNTAFLKDWLKGDEDVFKRTMAILAEEKPEKYADLYVKIHQTVISAQAKKTETNVKVSIGRDFDKLQALAGSVLPSRALESEDTKTEYVEYEEVPAKSKRLKSKVSR